MYVYIQILRIDFPSPHSFLSVESELLNFYAFFSADLKIFVKTHSELLSKVKG